MAVSPRERMGQVWEYDEIMKCCRDWIEKAGPLCQTPEQAADLVRPLMFRTRCQESFWVIHLSAGHNVLDVQNVSLGLADGVPVHPREVFSHAITGNACQIILAHWHPYTSPVPSAYDIKVTKSLVRAGRLIGIDVLDHVVLGAVTDECPMGYAAFTDLGLLPRTAYQIEAGR